MLGIDHQGNERYCKLKKCKLSVSGRFEQKLTEYIWFRNLSKSSHEKYFGSIEVREKNGEINHMGGQSPMRIDVLENIHLNIHLAGSEDFLLELEECLHNPVNRLETVHLGRAEDWLVFECVQLVELEKSNRDKDYNHFFWIPQQIEVGDAFDFDFNKVDGLFYNLPVFATIKDYDKSLNHHGEREFTYMRSKLNDGAITGVEYLYDKQSEIPVFLADFNLNSSYV